MTPGVPRQDRRHTRLRRLLSMGLPEITCRSRQEMLKLLDRARVERAGGVARPDRHAGLPVTLDQFRVRIRERFFPGPFDHRLDQLLATRVPGSVEAVVAYADACRRGTFDLLGYKGLSFGEPIDWHLDPVAGRRGPASHWSRIDALDHARVGDSKVPWEMNRHQWIVTMAQAYCVTRRERYAAAAVGHLLAWREANPAAIGINWSSSLELAFRIVSWTWTLVLLRDSATLTPKVFDACVRTIAGHARHVERFLSYYYSPNTHLTGEALGLLYAACAFPELDGAARWRDLASRILANETSRQFHDDGVYFEQSTTYQRYTAEIYLHYLLLADRNRLAVPPEVAPRVRRLVDFLVAVQRPDGSMPNIGDADGGWLLPLSRPEPLDFGPLFSLAAACFREPSYAWAARAMAPDTAWMLGTRGVEAFDSLPPGPPRAPATRAFSRGGYVVMRSSWAHDAHYLLFDTGPLGCPFSSAHGHADLLSIQCAAFGDTILDDPGTSPYTGGDRMRNYLRSSQAHSTVTVDGRSQAVPRAPFAWESRPTARLVQCSRVGPLEIAEGAHDAYAELPGGVHVRRRVVFVGAAYWLIVDDIEGASLHQTDVRFHFGRARVSATRDGWIRAHVDRGRGLLVKTFSTAAVRPELHRASADPPDGWHAPAYGVVEPSTVAVFSIVAPLPVRAVTVLWPAADIHAELPEVRLLPGDTGLIGGIDIPQGGHSILIGSDAISLTS